jgi:dihydropteroate synthase
MFWQIRGRELSLKNTLVMGILNLTPDSFSDGGEIGSVDEALRRVEQMLSEGADVIDIGGESSRPGSTPVDANDETKRVAPAIEAITERFDVPLSVDTTKSKVARAALDAGAEIVNDITAFRFDDVMSKVVAEYKCGVILMHSRGQFETLHTTAPAKDIFEDVTADFRRAIATAHEAGIPNEAIALDVGIGFGKTLEQNLALIAGIERLREEFPDFPFLIGTSRKSFIGKVLDGAPADQRLEGSIATAAIAVYNGVSIVRTHDIKETSAALKMVDAICGRS